VDSECKRRRGEEPISFLENRLQRPVVWVAASGERGVMPDRVESARQPVRGGERTPASPKKKIDRAIAEEHKH